MPSLYEVNTFLQFGHLRLKTALCLTDSGWLAHHLTRHSEEQNLRCFIPTVCVSGTPHSRQWPSSGMRPGTASAPPRPSFRQKDLTVFAEMHSAADIFLYPQPSRRSAFILSLCSSVMRPPSFEGSSSIAFTIGHRRYQIRMVRTKKEPPAGCDPN